MFIYPIQISFLSFSVCFYTEAGGAVSCQLPSATGLPSHLAACGFSIPAPIFHNCEKSSVFVEYNYFLLSFIVFTLC